uniref:Uncharacterized protein n=1 Tax=Oryza nivara TaxID=4536 RepID=A0A0E0JA91_ORYNI
MIPCGTAARWKVASRQNIAATAGDGRRCGAVDGGSMAEQGRVGVAHARRKTQPTEAWRWGVGSGRPAENCLGPRVWIWTTLIGVVEIGPLGCLLASIGLMGYWAILFVLFVGLFGRGEEWGAGAPVAGRWRRFFLHTLPVKTTMRKRSARRRAQSSSARNVAASTMDTRLGY